MFVSLGGPLWQYYLLDYLTMIVVLPAIIFALIAQARVKTTFNKYKKHPSMSGLTGAEAARRILAAASVTGVAVQPTGGSLTDNYNPKTGALSLSEEVFSGTDVAAIGVAAHEVGHAIQHSEGYFPLKLRSALVLATNIGSRVALPLALVGVLIEYLGETTGTFGTLLIAIGVVCYALSTVFALITLPVELNASRRARRLLLSTGILTEEETAGARKVLNAAAMTYVASLAVSLVYLLRFVWIISNIRKKR